MHALDKYKYGNIESQSNLSKPSHYLIAVFLYFLYTPHTRLSVIKYNTNVFAKQ